MRSQDHLCPKRSGPTTSEVQKRVVSCLLTLMDGVAPAAAVADHSGAHINARSPDRRDLVFIIGTTSRVNEIDSAIRRPGRIDTEVCTLHCLLICYATLLLCVLLSTKHGHSVMDIDIILTDENGAGGDRSTGCDRP